MGETAAEYLARMGIQNGGSGSGTPYYIQTADDAMGVQNAQNLRIAGYADIPAGSVFDNSSGLYVNPKTQTAYDPDSGSTYDQYGRKISGNGPQTRSDATNVIRNTSESSDIQRNVVNNNNSVTSQNSVMDRTGVYNTMSNETQTGFQNNNTQTNRTSVMNQTGTTNITGSERRYVDIPTPEQFLDEFANGFATYTQSLGLGALEGQWVMENMGLFLNEYLGELGAMAQRGEAVFKPSGFNNANEKFLGSRTGDVSSTRSQGQTNTSGTIFENSQSQQSGVVNTQGSVNEVGSQNTSGYTNTNQQSTNNQQVNQTEANTSQQDSQGYGADGTPGDPTSLTSNTNSVLNQNTNTQSNDNSLVNENNQLNTNTTRNENSTVNRNMLVNESNRINSNETMNRDTTQNVNTTEDVYSRDALGFVHSLAPADFMAQKFNAGTINLLFQGRRGMRQAMSRSGGAYTAKITG